MCGYSQVFLVEGVSNISGVSTTVIFSVSGGYFFGSFRRFCVKSSSSSSSVIVTLFMV